jgi:glycosyltransferase involved in cell wall biosynthesis
MSYKFDLCIITGIYPPDTGGPAKFAESFLAWAKRQNRKVAVISLTDNTDASTETHSARVNLISRRHRLQKRFILSIIAIRRMMRTGTPIIANGMFVETLVASYLGRRRVPYVCKVPGDIVWERARNSMKTDLDIDSFQASRLGIGFRILRKLFTLSLVKASLVIVPSSHLQNLVLLWGVPKSRIRLIYNSVDVNKFSPFLNHRKLFDVITVCRLVPWKGVDAVIRACAELNLTLAVVGEGPEKNSLQSLAKDLNASITFLGDITQDELPEVLNSARCFVLNSSFEATSYALMEARACGLFSIANLGTGSEEIINQNRDGILTRLGSQDLFEALLRFKNDRAFVTTASQLAIKDCSLRFNNNLNFQEIFNLVNAEDS